MTATDKFLKVGGLGTATTLSAPGYTAGGTSMNVGSTANYPTTTGFIVAVDEVQIVNGEEQRIDGSYNEYYAEVDTGTSFKNVVWVAGDNASKNYAAGATTRVYINVSSERDNRIIDGILAQHNQDGTHKNVTAASLTTTGNVTIGGTLTIANSTNTEGWNPLGVTPTLQSSNGQREFVLRYSGVDYTDRLQEGTKLKIPRTVTPGTQSTLLNGTNQYWSKTAPAGMTFTDDFACGAWVYLTSYPTANAYIISRFNGTSGFGIAINMSGQVDVIGFNAGVANLSRVTSYQSVPLFKWVHVAGQLDMSAFTTTTTTSYTMVDGVNVPAVVARSGTNPTALVQAGNLEVGSANAANFFPGHIKNAWISSAKVTQANIQQFMNADITSTVVSANNIISAFNFNGNGNDANTTNANNLTANNGVTATSTNVNFKPTEYVIVTKAPSYSGGNTDVTVFSPQGTGIPNETLGTASYASVASPYGFPMDRNKWRISNTYIARSNTAGGTATNTYVQIPGIEFKIPTGSWKYGARTSGIVVASTSVNFASFTASLSTNTTSLSVDAVSASSPNTNSSNGQLSAPIVMESPLVTTSMTTYYFIMRSIAAGATHTFYMPQESGNLDYKGEIYAETTYL